MSAGGVAVEEMMITENPNIGPAFPAVSESSFHQLG
jgi:hypothetical protein